MQNPYKPLAPMIALFQTPSHRFRPFFFIDIEENAINGK
jgi:hypothetical protein